MTNLSRGRNALAVVNYMNALSGAGLVNEMAHINKFTYMYLGGKIVIFLDIKGEQHTIELSELDIKSMEKLFGLNS